MSKKEKVSVVALDAQSLPRAQAFALRLKTTASGDPDVVSGLVLEVSQDRLALRDAAQPRTRALTIDTAKRRYAPAGKDLLARALGRQCESIIDATAGFGSDTFDFVRRGKIVLAEFGYGGKLLPSLPTWLIDGTRPRRLSWLLKSEALPWIYWNGMLKGHEWLARPQVKTAA